MNAEGESEDKSQSRKSETKKSQRKHQCLGRDREIRGWAKGQNESDMKEIWKWVGIEITSFLRAKLKEVDGSRG